MAIRLIEMDASLLVALSSGARFHDAYDAEVGPHLDEAREMVGHNLEHAGRVAAQKPWVGYLVADSVANVVMGGCGFKGNPTADGSVEISYGTFLPFRGRGLATAMARELLAVAQASGKVERVIAHTLPAENASTRVLVKAGFQHVGETEDPEDGRLWRWRCDLE